VPANTHSMLSRCWLGNKKDIGPFCSSITPSLFHCRLKTYLFHKSYPRSFTCSFRTAFTHYCLDRLIWGSQFLFLVFPFFFISVPCARLSWPSRQLLSTCKYTLSHRTCRSPAPVIFWRTCTDLGKIKKVVRLHNSKTSISHETDKLQSSTCLHTVAERSGPFQQFWPCSYFISEYLLSDGPDHVPHLL